MTIPAWPTGLPYASARSGFQTSQLDNSPLRSEMNSGTTLTRQKTSLLIAKQKISLELKGADLTTFHTFWKTTLLRGCSRFTMPVWNGTAYVTRTVLIVEGPAETNLTPDVTSVTMTLMIENLI